MEAPTTNRQAPVDYILEEGETDPTADGNWSFAPVGGDVAVYFDTSPAAAEVHDGEAFKPVEGGADGCARYRLTLWVDPIRAPLVVSRGSTGSR